MDRYVISAEINQLQQAFSDDFYLSSKFWSIENVFFKVFLWNVWYY